MPTSVLWSGRTADSPPRFQACQARSRSLSRPGTGARLRVAVPRHEAGPLLGCEVTPGDRTRVALPRLDGRRPDEPTAVLAEHDDELRPIWREGDVPPVVDLTREGRPVLLLGLGRP